MDCQATVPMGEVSRGGLTRGDDEAGDHDLGWQAKDLPWGMVEEEGGPLPITFGRSSKTSDVIVEALEAWGAAWDETEPVAMTRLQITIDNGPASSGRRTQFWQRRGAFCAALGKPMPLLYYPPSHSQYHPIERCWGILEWHGNGPKLVDVETMLEGAKRMTWKGMHPSVALSRQVYQKGVTLSQRAMRAVANRLTRHPELPNWDILIQPVSTS